MTYLGREISRRFLPVVTFVLISFLISGKLVRARPQENFVASSHDSNSDGGAANSSEIKEVVTEKTDPEIAAVENDNRNEVNANDVLVETKSTTPVEIIRAVTGTPIKFYAEYSVNSGLDFGRAAADASTKVPTTTINTLKPLFTKQLMPASATDMVITDVRTPPKIKSQISHSHTMQSMSSSGKGEAIPVLLDGNEEAALEKISSDNFKYTHSDATPPSGLSTWILLNSDTVSTPYSHKKVHKPVLYDVTNLTTSENSTEVKRKQKPQILGSTTENSIKSKIESVAAKKPDRKPIATIQKVNQTFAKKPSTLKIDPDMIQTTTSVSLQDLKFKNKTPVIVGKVPVTTTKLETNNTTPITFFDTPVDNGTRLGTPVVTFPHVPVRQRPSSSTTRKPFISTSRPILQSVPVNNAPQRISSTPQELTVIGLPTSSLSTEGTSVAATTDLTTEISTEVSTKKASTSTSSKKKKKKNKKKNKRRRPSSKKPARVQSKISEDDNSTGTSKLPNTGLTSTSRPLSTRIYNYLAREVMPNVGVGIVGLMLTAGLAGLLLYPFGAAVPIRRNYEKPSHPPYNLNDYPPINEVDNAQPEESVLSQVLAGMPNMMNQYSREQPDLVYKNPPPKYKPARFDNPPTFTHIKENKFTTEKSVDNIGSDLGDVVSGPHESVKFTPFDINDSMKYPSMENSQPSPSYSTLDFTTNSHNEPMTYPKYKGTVTNAQANPIMKQAEPSYSTLGEYSSFNNPNELIQSPVYTGESYDYKNHKQDQDIQEFKVSSELEVVTQITENQTTTASPTTASTAKTAMRHEQPSFAALEGIPKNYRTLQTSIRFEEPASVLPMNQDFVPSEAVGVYPTSMEHGPRSMRLRRRKRNLSSENELDSVLLDQHMSEKSTPRSPAQMTTTNSPSDSEKMTTTIATNSTDISNEIFEEVKTDVSTVANSLNETNAMSTSSTTTVVPESSSSTATNEDKNSTDISTERPKDESTTGSYQVTCENCDLVNVEEPSPPAQTFSLSTLIRKLLDFKLRLGLELIRATSEAIGRYLGNVQARMTEALRNIQRSAFRTNNDNRNKKVTKRRDKRQINLFFDKLD